MIHAHDSDKIPSCYLGPDYFREEELARLVFIVVTPDPPTGASRTSTDSNCHAFYGAIAKDALILVLEGIVQSSDAFPPLKSAASGLLFFTTCADVSIQSFAPSTHMNSSITRWLPAIRSKSATSTGASIPSRHHSSAARKTEICSPRNIRRPSLHWRGASDSDRAQVAQPY